MDTIYNVVRYKDEQGAQPFSITRAFTHRDQAMKFIQRMGIQTDTSPQFQPVPLGSVFDATVIGTQNIRVSLIPTKITIGTDIISPISTSVVEVITPMRAPVEVVVRPNRPVSRFTQSLIIRDTGDYWYVSGGNSYPRRDELKELGGTWNPNAKVWMIPKTNINEIVLRQILE